MQLTIDITEKDLVEFSKESIQKEIRNVLKWLKIKQSFNKISEDLKEIDNEHELWLSISGNNLENAYGDKEPEYKLDLIKKENPDYEGR